MIFDDLSHFSYLKQDRIESEVLQSDTNIIII